MLRTYIKQSSAKIACEWGWGYQLKIYSTDAGCKDDDIRGGCEQ